jgi:hypothetical protein
MFIHLFVSRGTALVGTNMEKVMKLPTCFLRTAHGEERMDDLKR